MADNKHVEWFQKTHMSAGESVVTSVGGYVDKKPGLKRGALIVTNRRVVFCHKGWFGEHLEHFDLSKVTAVERSSNLLGAKTTVRASGAALEFHFNHAPEAIKALHDALDAGRQSAPHAAV